VTKLSNRVKSIY